MSTGQIAAPYGRLRGPVVTALVLGAFAVGAATGISLPRAASGGSHPDAAAGYTVQAPSFAGVADNNMSDAARRAIYGPTVQARTFAGVADNNMSDAARRAIYDSQVDH